MHRARGKRTMAPNIQLRLAVPEDVPVLRELIEASVRGLQTQDYTPAQIEGALKTVFGVDTQLIADGTYIVAEARAPGAGHKMIVGCGGWSKRRTLYGSDHWTGREACWRARILHGACKKPWHLTSDCGSRFRKTCRFCEN